LAELEAYKKRGLIRHQVVNEQLREKARTEAEVSRLQGQFARLQQNMGEIDVKIEDVRSAYRRQVVTELQETLQRLRETQVSLGTAHELRAVLAQDEGGSEGNILLTRTRQRGVTTFKATSETMLEPGDVIEVKRRRHEGDRPTPPPSESAPAPSQSALLERTATHERNARRK
jgi:polysaccharide export outer membrane protein